MQETRLLFIRMPKRKKSLRRYVSGGVRAGVPWWRFSPDCPRHEFTGDFGREQRSSYRASGLDSFNSASYGSKNTQSYGLSARRLDCKSFVSLPTLTGTSLIVNVAAPSVVTVGERGLIDFP